MFGIEALEVVIGLIFVYLLFSLFVSIVNEIINQFLKIRGKELRFSIERMIGKALRDQFYENPKINKTKYRSSFFYGTPFWGIYLWIRTKFSRDIDVRGDDLKKKITNNAYPSEISPTTFADTLIEIIRDKKQRDELFRQAPFLEQIYERADGEIEVLRNEIEDWFNEIMAYTSEWYKQKLRYVLLALGFLTAAGFNVDAITIFKTLANNPETRRAVVQQAEGFIESHNLEEGVVVEVAVADTAGTTTSTSHTLKSSYAIHDFLRSQYEHCGNTTACVDSVNAAYPILARIDRSYETIHALVQEDIEQVSSVLGLGWGNLSGKTGFWDWVLRVIGWAVTAVAISLGAPFWFDLLKRVINLKNEITKGKDTATQPK
ncbi:hypothetical protein ACG2F4_03260 [Halalkalibaculum sp. DA3122]|uniref:hypothetical protein n=1 Tax=Halalkalibaculum sp. DA3122 TaxID=3373607 RepID=UPI003753F16D